MFILLDSRWWLVSSFLNSTWDRCRPRADSAEQEPDADRCVAQWDQNQPSLGSLQGYGCRAGCDLTASAHIRDVRGHGGQSYKLWRSDRSGGNTCVPETDSFKKKVRMWEESKVPHITMSPFHSSKAEYYGSGGNPRLANQSVPVCGLMSRGSPGADGAHGVELWQRSGANNNKVGWISTGRGVKGQGLVQWPPCSPNNDELWIFTI